jgi:hypothetical protein
LILFRGTYGGAVEPERHYIPLEKDFSNIEEVVERVRDNAYLDELADRAYDDLVASGRYSLRSLVAEFDALFTERARPVGRQAKDCYHHAARRRRIPTVTGPSRLRAAVGRLLAPPVGVLLTLTDPQLRRIARAGLGRRHLAQDLRRLTMLRRGVARSTFHVVAEVVAEDRLLFLSSRPGSPPTATRDVREALAAALEADAVEHIVWNHSRVAAGAGVAGGSLLLASVGHHGIDGAYAFQVLPALAHSQRDLVLAALEPMLREPAREPTPTVGVEA